MKNRHDDTPEITDYTYYVFEEIEKRGLQFAIPEQWRPLYRSFLRERVRRKAVIDAFAGISDAFRTSKGTGSTRYSESFGNRGETTPEKDPQANTATRPLEE
jgi:hypothetical protein